MRDIDAFSEMTGDRNPIHYGRELARALSSASWGREVRVDDASVAAKAALSGPIENLSVRLLV